ncbi:MAG: hypothetical protein WEC00_13530, partial [Dongiaceae bacterium]
MDQPGGNDAPAVKGRRRKPSSRHPNRIADEILEQRKIVSDRVGVIYGYDHNYWRELSIPELQRIAFDADGPDSIAARRTEIVAAVRAKSFDPKLTWSRVADDEVPCANFVYNVTDGDVRTHDPADYLERVLPVPYRPGAKFSRWLEALEQWFGCPNCDEIKALQEFFGYVVLPHVKFKKALVLHGGPNCGKSVIVTIMREL